MDALDPILALRPFIPARDYDLSRRFYEALGFAATHRDDDVTILKLGSFCFILRNYYVAEFADNCMVRLLVRDVDAWWARVVPARLVETFGVNPPKAPPPRAGASRSASWSIRRACSGTSRRRRPERHAPRSAARRRDDPASMTATAASTTSTRNDTSRHSSVRIAS